MHTDLLFETIQELRRELECVNQVIDQIEALVEGRTKRGRPPKALAQAREALVGERGKARRRAEAEARDNDVSFG